VPEHSVDNIARFFGSKSGIQLVPAPFARPTMDIPTPNGASGSEKASA
jgi:hypothetical protein